jgi:hypothetical protein
VLGGGSSAGGVAGERRQRRRGNRAAAVRSPARERTQLRNVWRVGLQGDPGEVLRVPIGLESGRGHGLGRACPAEAAGARIPVSYRLGLSNTRKGELLGALVELVAARIREEW